MHDPIAIFSSLPPAKERPRRLLKSFESEYGEQASYVARAPGRVRSLSSCWIRKPCADLPGQVSIIGEHIDYAGLSVLPAAIDRDVIMACSFASSRDDKSRIRIANVNSRFPAEDIEYASASDGPTIDPKAHSWVNYFKAGLKGVLDQLPQAAKSQAIDLKIMVDGNVPPGGGLSSSAAMVVASALATLQAYGTVSETTQGQLAEIAITSERLVGVNSGGMDQSASIFSRQSHVLNVDFVPELGATLVPFPDAGMAYVIANTLVVSEKQKTAKYNYNRRFVELTTSATLLAAHLGLQLEVRLPTLKHVMDGYFAEKADAPADPRERLQEMLRVVEEAYGDRKEGHSWDDIYSRLGGVSREQFRKTFHPDFEIEADNLKLYARTKHAVCKHFWGGTLPTLWV